MTVDAHTQLRGTEPLPAGTGDLARTTTLPPRGLAAYFLIAFGFSWLTWWLGTTVLAGGNPMPFTVVGSFGPAVAALLVTAVVQGRAGVGALFRRYSPRGRGIFLPYLAALAPCAFILASGLIPVLLEGASIREAELAAQVAVLPATILFMAVAGGGNEELGWRGFALPRLQSALPPFAANVVLGLIWAVWHAPLWQLQGTSQSAGMSFPVYVLLVVTFSVTFGQVFNASRGGLLTVVIAHTGVNVASGLKLAALGDAGELDSLLALTLLCALLLLVTRGRLALPRQKAPAGNRRGA